MRRVSRLRIRQLNPPLFGFESLSPTVPAAFTVAITWRARTLEATLERQSEEPSLVDKLAPDFSASTLDGRTVSLFFGEKRKLS